MIQVGHNVDNAHTAIEHLSANRVPKGMRREAIDLTIWAEQWHLLRKGGELIAEAAGIKSVGLRGLPWAFQERQKPHV